MVDVFPGDEVGTAVIDRVRTGRKVLVENLPVRGIEFDVVVQWINAEAVAAGGRDGGERGDR